MREVFLARERRDPGRVFYTILAEDVGKTVIQTEIGPILVNEFIGRIRSKDIGKRLYRVPNNAGDYWYWQLEGKKQFEERKRKEVKDQ
jgi:hypothetical protein